MWNGVRGGSSAAWWTALGCCVTAAAPAISSRGTAYRQGLATNLLLFRGLIPQFVAVAEPAFRTCVLVALGVRVVLLR